MWKGRSENFYWLSLKMVEIRVRMTMFVSYFYWLSLKMVEIRVGMTMFVSYFGEKHNLFVRNKLD